MPRETYTLTIGSEDSDRNRPEAAGSLVAIGVEFFLGQGQSLRHILGLALNVDNRETHLACPAIGYLLLTSFIFLPKFFFQI